MPRRASHITGSHGGWRKRNRKGFYPVLLCFCAMTVMWVCLLLYLLHRPTAVNFLPTKKGMSTGWSATATYQQSGRNRIMQEDSETGWYRETTMQFLVRLTAKLVYGSAPISTMHNRQPSKQYDRPIVIPMLHFRTNKLLTSLDDPIYQWGCWDCAPIVVESHKLIFFTIPKVGCTVFKQLFRRMYGYQDWNVQDDFLPHHPTSNGLNYLYHYMPREAERMLTDPNWTKAIFFRDPQERLLSAYLDKVLHNKGHHVRTHCCNQNGSKSTLAFALSCHVPVVKLPDPLITFPTFLKRVVPHCNDPHWRPQAYRMPEQYWPYINFVGHMEHLADDTRTLLQHIGAWEDFGATGWPPQSGAIFAGPAKVAHATNAHQQVAEYYASPDLVKLAQRVHSADYQRPFIGATTGS